MLKHLKLLIILLGLGLAACTAPPAVAPTATRTPPAAGIPTDLALSATPGTGAAPGAMPAPTAAPGDPTATPIGPYGPADFPADVNPLTGLPVSDPAVLNRRPLLIKVSNHPPVVRPQTGLMAADHVWQHEVENFNMTRFTAVYLTNTPERVGSVRSGRPPDFDLVPMYDGIFFSSGFSTNRPSGGPPRMRELMIAAPWFERNFSQDFGYGEPYAIRVPREGLAFEHTLFAVPAELWRLASERSLNTRPTLEPGFAFDVVSPPGGTLTTEIMVDYPGEVGPVETWRYDQATGRWLRWTNGEPLTDALTNTQLAFDNVVIVYAQHYSTDWIEDEHSGAHAVGIVMTGEGNAILLRDGQRYTIKWRDPDTESMMQFFDASGNVIPFKPGTTWFHLVDTTVFESTITFAP